ncbi:hypothetical protein Pst134EB_012209 [Puccinia striiformis f. sp. tritici]|nr:hypothetical protein Pst134EB_012209 [Puccinia striiformis f. sp. tritici]
MSVEEYNTQFGSLVYLVDMSDGDCIARHINGLNLNVHKRATGLIWQAAKTLKDKMDLAVEGAKDLEMLSRISDPHSAPKPKPAPPHHSPLYHHPHSSQRAPDAMDIDAATTHPNQRPDEVYEDVVDADLATVKVQLDTSRSGHIMVRVSFQVSPSKSVVASVLVDAGAMANFVNKRFINKNHLSTRLRKNPIRCIGFDGNEGVGGLVTHDWVGRIHVSLVDSATAIPFPSSFCVTCLGLVDAIFSLPWLDCQTWTASGSSSSGHRFVSGSTEIFVVDAFSLGEELEG